jgi:hypothetical protein
MGFVRDDSRDQGTLFPVSLDELVPQDHVSRVIANPLERGRYNRCYRVEEHIIEIEVGAVHARILAELEAIYQRERAKPSPDDMGDDMAGN